MTVRTAQAHLTETQAASMFDGGKGVRAVLVDGIIVGLYAKNKYGMTIGTFDPEALNAQGNPFVATRTGYAPRPAGRPLGRSVKDLVADIANRVPARYEVAA